MRVWRPVRSLGGAIGFLLAVLLWLGTTWLVMILPGPVSGRTFWLVLGIVVSFLLGAVFIYWSIAFLTLRYSFDRNGLILHWGGTYQVIPMNRITSLRRWRDGERVWQRGLHWPGYQRGHGRSDDLGQVRFYATAARKRQYLVCTAEQTYVISPRNPEEFLREMEVRRDLGMTRQLAQERHYWWIFHWPLWRDAPLWGLILAALAVNLSLFALLCYHYPTLPRFLPIHFVELVEEGQTRIDADIIGQPQDLFKPPTFGLLLLGVNLSLGALLHRRHRLLVLILAAVTLLVQVIFWLGVYYVLAR